MSMNKTALSLPFILQYSLKTSNDFSTFMFCFDSENSHVITSQQMAGPHWSKLLTRFVNPTVGQTPSLVHTFDDEIRKLISSVALTNQKRSIASIVGLRLFCCCALALATVTSFLHVCILLCFQFQIQLVSA